jgi:hypothetical protein
VLWTTAVVAGVMAFVLHLALRGRNVELGYQLGRERNEQARLREIKRVLELEAASYKTPQRVEVVARTLLGLEPPSPDRMIPLASRAPQASGPDSRAPQASGPDNRAPDSPAAGSPRRGEAPLP